MPLFPILIVLGGCGLFAPDLPAGWEDAESIDDFTQGECDGSADTGDPTEVTAWAESPGIRVAGDPIHFRCEQDVEGFYKTDGVVVDVLVRPWPAGAWTATTTIRTLGP